MSFININTPNYGTLAINDSGVPEICPNAPAANAVVLKNRAADGYSTIEFQDSDGAKKLFVGHGNPSSVYPGQSYIMTANGSDLVIYGSDGVSTRECLRVTAGGHVVLPKCSGTPTGTPPDGAIIVDTENERIYVRVGNIWKYAQLIG